MFFLRTLMKFSFLSHPFHIICVFPAIAQWNCCFFFLRSFDESCTFFFLLRYFDKICIFLTVKLVIFEKTVYSVTICWNLLHFLCPNFLIDDCFFSASKEISPATSSKKVKKQKSLDLRKNLMPDVNSYKSCIVDENQ